MILGITAMILGAWAVAVTLVAARRRGDLEADLRDRDRRIGELINKVFALDLELRKAGVDNQRLRAHADEQVTRCAELRRSQEGLRVARLEAECEVLRSRCEAIREVLEED